MPYPSKLTPDTILDAALALLREGGVDALGMRPLAERLGVRPSSLYRYYSHREALLGVLEAGAAHSLHSAIRGAVAEREPREAFLAAGEAYLDYARQEPQLYALLLRDEQVYLAEPGAGKDLWNEALQLVGSVTGNPDDTAGAVAFWAFVHGFVVLERSGMFGPTGPKGGFERGLRALLEGLSR